MKNLGQIQIGGSLDITTNKHVEDLIEEAIEGLDIPEDTNTTYTLTQDGLTVQLVDDQNSVVSEIALPEVEDTVYTLRILEGNRGRHTLDLVDADGMMVSRVNFTIPNDTNTTYTLRRDGDTRIEIIGNDGHVSGVDIASLLPEEKDPYQEVKGIPLPPVNLFDAIRTEGYEDFELTSEYDEENNLISIHLHLGIEGIERTFTLADNVSNEFNFYLDDGRLYDTIKLEEIYKQMGMPVIISGGFPYAGRVNFNLDDAQLQVAADLEQIPQDGILITGSNMSQALPVIHFVLPGVNENTESEPATITATLEDHLQRIYGSIHNS